MVFEHLITIDAAEIRLKHATSTCFALEWLDWIMLFMSVFALTRWSPDIYVKSFPSRQVPLTNFLWSSWNKPESCTLTVIAVCFLPFLTDLALMIAEKMTTEAS
jgi:hypothetical protein